MRDLGSGRSASQTRRSRSSSVHLGWTNRPTPITSSTWQSYGSTNPNVSSRSRGRFTGLPRVPRTRAEMGRGCAVWGSSESRLKNCHLRPMLRNRRTPGSTASRGCVRPECVSPPGDPWRSNPPPANNNGSLWPAQHAISSRACPAAQLHGGVVGGACAERVVLGGKCLREEGVVRAARYVGRGRLTTCGMTCGSLKRS